MKGIDVRGGGQRAGNMEEEGWGRGQERKKKR